MLVGKPRAVQPRRPKYLSSSSRPSPHLGCYHLSRFFFGIQETLQVADAGWVTQLAKGFGFDLPNAFASDVVHLPDFLKGALVAIDQSEAHFENLSFPLGQTREDVAEFFL